MGLATVVLAVAVVLGPGDAASTSAAEPAALPQVYVGTGDGYSIAFKVEGPAVYVLGVDATVYCEVLEPREATKPALEGFFAAPVRMEQGRTGLTVSEEGGSEFLSHELIVSANLEGGKLIGSFRYRFNEESGHCQTAGYFGTQPEVAFEAVPYEPVDGSAPPPPFADADSAVYYGTVGPLESFFSVFHSAFGLRGTVASRCLAPRGKQKPGRGPLGSSIVIGTFAADRSFQQKARLNGPGGNSSIKEAITVAGTVDDGSISGTYRDRIAIHRGKRKQVCQTGPLAFSATRFVPAVAG